MKSLRQTEVNELAKVVMSLNGKSTFKSMQISADLNVWLQRPSFELPLKTVSHYENGTVHWA